MTGRARDTNRVGRRALLAGLAAGTAGGLAGCIGGGQGSGGNGTTANADTLPAPVQGDPDASVRVVVFEDFACPHCREFSLNVVPRLESEYVDPGTIRYEFHDFPIPVHEEISWEAACAARAVQAAAGAGAFFEYAHALFENQASLGPSMYEQLADEQGLDGAAIRESAVNREYIATVRADRRLGRRIGVQGTPTVIVGQRGVRPTFEAISGAIESQRSGSS